MNSYHVNTKTGNAGICRAQQAYSHVSKKQIDFILSFSRNDKEILFVVLKEKIKKFPYKKKEDRELDEKLFNSLSN